MAHGRLNRIYFGMLARCGHCPGRPRDRKRYADRGIFVCEEWRADFATFATWALANGYADHLQIDRIDNDGPYSPGNSRWVTPAENSRNSSTTRLTHEKAKEIRTLRASGMTLNAIAGRYGISIGNVCHVLNGLTWKEPDA